jgi:D-xylose transport system substrate-binding protein
MKTIRVLMLVLALALVAAACSSDDSTDTTAAGGDATETTVAAETGSIWVLLPDSASSARWETDDRKFFEEAFDAAGVEYNIVNAEGDPVQQQSQAEQAIADGAKVILLVNLDSASGAAIIQIARDGGAQVIDYDRLTIEGDGADVYVSFDNVAVGATMAEFVEPAMDALGVTPVKLALLNGGPTDNNSKLFKEGYTTNLDARVAAGDWELVAEEDTPDWDNQEALRIYEQMLVANPDGIDATFAANDGLANSVISARKSAGLGPIPLSGQDATVAGMQNVLSGWQTMSVYKAIKAEAGAAAAVALALLAGDAVDSVSGDWTLIDIDNGTNMVPYVALVPVGVTADNMADTVIADGFRTWDEICVGDFEEFCPDGWDS